MFILAVCVITLITIFTLHYQSHYTRRGKTSPAIITATLYTLFSFLFYENHKIAFIFMFFYVSVALWSMAVIAPAMSKRWSQKVQ